MNSLQKWRNDRGYTRERVADMFGLKWGTIQSYELGRRTPLLSTRKLIQRVTRGAVPTWCWGWQVFVYENDNTWPDFLCSCETITNDPLDIDFVYFADEQDALDWRENGVRYYRRKGNDDGSGEQAAD